MSNAEIAERFEAARWTARAAGELLVEEAGGWHAPFAPPSPTAKAMCVAAAPGNARELEALVIAAG